MRASMFRNIIWDVDGTLFDTYPAIAKAFQVALNDLGKDASLD
jgi:phosphoglycolate phosphatase-like HAD superfamily hydrolase